MAETLQQCALLIFVLLLVSPVLSSQTSLPGPQVQPTTKTAVEKNSTEPSTCYAVQVGAYEDQAEGAAMLNKLLMRAFPYRMTLTPVVMRDKTLWRLRVLTTSRVEALKVSGRLLGEQGIKAWIVPIPCTDKINGEVNSPILAPHTESPGPASFALSPTPIKNEIASLSSETQVIAIVPETGSPAPPKGEAVSPEGVKREATGQATLSHLRRVPVSTLFGTEEMGIALGEVRSSDRPVGVKITEVTPKSPAAKAGLAVNDIIMAIDGNAVKTEQALDAELADRKPGSEVSVTFMHVAWVMKATITIESQASTSDGSLGTVFR